MERKRVILQNSEPQFVRGKILANYACYKTLGNNKLANYVHLLAAIGLNFRYRNIGLFSGA